MVTTVPGVLSHPGEPARSWGCSSKAHSEVSPAQGSRCSQNQVWGHHPPPAQLPHLVVQLEPLHVDPHELGFHLEPARFLAGDDVKDHVPEPERTEALATKSAFKKPKNPLHIPTIPCSSCTRTRRPQPGEGQRQALVHPPPGLFCSSCPSSVQSRSYILAERQLLDLQQHPLVKQPGRRVAQRLQLLVLPADP